MKVHYGIPIIVVLVALTAAFSLAQAQDPYLTPIQFLPGDNTIGPVCGDQTEPDIARGGNMYLAAWTDGRAGLFSFYSDDQSGTDIYAARLDSTGALLDSIPIVISQEAAQQNTPFVVWNGENWLVVWLSQVPDQYSSTWGVRAVRVSPQGQILDNPPIEVPLTSSSGFRWTMCAASDGSNWVVVRQGMDSGSAAVYGVRISPQGVVLDPQGVIILPETYYVRYNLGIAFAQDEYLLIWKSIDHIQGLRLTTSLQWIDANPFNIVPPDDYPQNPQLASNGTDFLVGWLGNFQMVARVSHSGQVLDPNGIIVSQMGGYNNNPRLAWDGTNWVAAWGELYAARITTNGNVLDPGGDLFPGGLKVDIITGGVNGGIQVVYKDGPWQNLKPYDIFAVNISRNMTAGQPSCISLGTPSQVTSRVAGSGSGWMAVYLSVTSGNCRILAQPLDADGDPLMSLPVQIASGLYVRSPSVAWNGSLYMVTWNEASSNLILGRRILQNGTPLDQYPFAVMSGYQADVAALGDTFLVVGTIQDAYFPQLFVYAQCVRVRGSDGAILDPSPVNLGSSYASRPRVTKFGNSWASVWARYYSNNDPMNEVMRAFIGPDGTTSGEFSVVVGGHRNSPTIAASADTALIVWHQNWIDWDLLAKRLLPNGTLLDGNGFAVTSAANKQTSAEMAWDGSQFIVMYKDERAKTFFLDLRTDIYGTRVSASGQVLDPEGFVFANTTLPEMDPAIASANGVSIITGSVFRDTAPYTSYRIGFRLMGLPSACCDVQMVPDNTPVVVPPGGSFGLTGTVGNPTQSPIITDVLVGVWYMNNFFQTWNFQNIPLNAGQYLSAHLNQNVPMYAPAGTYRYIAYCGDQQTGTICDSVFFDFTVTGAALDAGANDWTLEGGWDVPAEIPNQVSLIGSYPNPFNAQTSIQFGLPEAGNVNLTIYNLMGQKVVTIVNGEVEAGNHAVVWDAANYSSGIYFYRLSAGEKTFTKRMTLLK